MVSANLGLQRELFFSVLKVDNVFFNSERQKKAESFIFLQLERNSYGLLPESIEEL